MSILRMYFMKNYVNLREIKFNTFSKYWYCTERKVEVQEVSGTEKVTIPITTGPPTTVAVQPVTPATDLLVKPEQILPKVIDPTSITDSAPFEEVPGPRVLQHIAKVWSLIPMMGNQVTASTVQYMLGANKILGSQLTWGRNLFWFRYLSDEYGPIVRLQGPFGGDVVVLTRPEDALTVFTSEGRYPIRSSLDCIEKYRLQHRRFKNAGPFLMHGEDWEKLRNQVVTSLSSSSLFQFKKIEDASEWFILRIKKIKNRQDEVPSTFSHDLCKWSLESLCSVILGHNLNFLNDKNTVSTSESARILTAFYGATDAIRRCETGLHLWKFMETPAWKALVKHCETIDSIMNKYLKEAKDSLRDRKNDALLTYLSKDNIPLLEAMLLQDGMYPEDILTVFLDMLLIGVNATTHSMAFLFYHLARCPRAQRILADEVRTIPDTLTPKTVIKLKYLQACIKESLRLKPPIPFLSRILTRDVVVHNYRIPKGTVILMATYLSSVREEHFDDALKFIPERWLNSELSSSDSNFACIPFGYGPKACLARHLAEMQLSVLLIKILRSFKIEYHYGDIQTTNKMLASPNRALKFRFINRLI